jgi:hypothetical protein
MYKCGSVFRVEFLGNLVGNEVEDKTLAFFLVSEEEVVVVNVVTVPGLVGLGLEKEGQGTHLFNFFLFKRLLLRMDKIYKYVRSKD